MRIATMNDECPECGDGLEDSADYHCMATHNCCKCCYDDHHFGEPELNHG